MSDSPVARFPKNGQGKPEQIAAPIALWRVVCSLSSEARRSTSLAACSPDPTQTPKEALT